MTTLGNGLGRNLEKLSNVTEKAPQNAAGGVKLEIVE